MLRERTDYENSRKTAAQHAVNSCMSQLQLLERYTIADDVLQRCHTHLRAFESELASATDDLLRSRRDIGTVRSLVHSKGLPVPPRQRLVRPLPWGSSGDLTHDSASDEL